MSRLDVIVLPMVQLPFLMQVSTTEVEGRVFWGYVLSKIGCAPLHRPADRLQHFHEHRVVWTSEVQRFSALAGHFDQLGHCVLRIHPSSSGQSLWSGDDDAFSVEGHSRGFVDGDIFGCGGCDAERTYPLEYHRWFHGRPPWRRHHFYGRKICLTALLPGDLSTRDCR